MSHRLSMDELQAISHQVMIEKGFNPDFSDEATRQATGAPEDPPHVDGVKDLRLLPWSSIDNPESLDLDQIEVAEQLPSGAIRVLVGIADVDLDVPLGSPVDARAAQNTTSVYTGVAVYPMLPEALSTDRTSLREERDRLAVVTEFTVTPEGEATSGSVYRALVRNVARLNYPAVGAWFDTGRHFPELNRLPGLEAQLRLQDEAAGRLHEFRIAHGALDFETTEAQAVVSDGKVQDLQLTGKNRARYLIENFMIAANVTMAGFLEHRGTPTIERVVKEPERWPRIVELAASLGYPLPAAANAQALAGFLAARRKKDPDHYPDLSLSVIKLLGPGEYAVVATLADRQGHFGLGVQSYTHSTAPNRRYPDLVIQRLVKAAVSGQPTPYTAADLETVAAHCTERAQAARKVERQMRKVLAADLLSDRIGEVFKAIVTGVTRSGIFVRSLHPPVEGMVTHTSLKLDVGDRVEARLLATDPHRGYIDFAVDRWT